MAMSSVRRLISKSLSTKHQSKSSPQTQSFADENAPPTHPNIQTISLPNPKTSPSTLSTDPPVKVVVRIRPKTVTHKLEDPTINKVAEDSVAAGPRNFTFDSVLDSNSNQESVFQLVGVPLVKDALAGYNASIMSYGQSGSGKTYTMWGPPSAMLEGGQTASSQQGIVPRIFKMLFSEIERAKENSGTKLINYQCRCSFLEIYNGQIGDLLDPTQRNLQIKDDAKNGFNIESLSEEYVTSYDDVTQILIKGLSNRKVGATSTNSKSSRSHVIFTCLIESWCKEIPSNSYSSSKTSRINFVDLAGLDRHKQAEQHKEFEKESKFVKGSLSHLGHLVNILVGGTQPDDIMYLDSCLTHLLQQSLGGNAKLSVICTISPDIKNYSETLRTLRFGHLVRAIQNKPVINEITEEDMDDLTDQIRQLKEELIRAKLNVGSTKSGNQQCAGSSVRESMNQLRISLNRSLMLSHIDDSTKDEVVVDENDITELCKQLDRLHKSCEKNSRETPCDSESINFASVQGSYDSYFTSEHEINCLHECEEISSVESQRNKDPAMRNGVAMTSSLLSAAFEEPPLSESPKIRNIQRKSIAKPPSILVDDNTVSGSSKFCPDIPGKQVADPETIRSSLRTSKIFSGPTESLAASLKRGLEIIDSDSHQQSSSPLRKSSVAFSFEHLMLKPSPAADKVNASVQTLSEGSPSLDGSSSSFICLSCRRKQKNVSNEADGLKTWIAAPEKEDAKEDISQANKRIMELEKVCTEQAAKIEELTHLLKNEKAKDVPQSKEVIENSNEELDMVKEDCEIEDKKSNGFCDAREKEELLMEIQYLRNKLQAYAADLAPNKSIDKLRSSLLSHSKQLHESMSCQFNNSEEELEKERQKWTEMESEWINLTDELRIDIESQRQHALKLEKELQQERKYTEELDDALHRAVLGHARFLEHYVELQEKYEGLYENHRRIMETIADVKRAASKAGSKGCSARYAKAFAAELSATRQQEKKERECLRRENNALKIQLRETAEAVQTAGELLARLKEAEGAASIAEANINEVQRENEKLKKQMEKQKKKHKMEMTTMKQYIMAESKLPESALHPLHSEEPIPTSTFPASAHDQAWTPQFGAAYQLPHFIQLLEARL